MPRTARWAGLLRDRALLAAGAPLQEVRAPLEQAYVLARACGSPPLLWASADALGGVLARLGQEQEAAAYRAAARATIAAIGDGICDPTLQRSFLGAAPIQRIRAGA